MTATDALFDLTPPAPRPRTPKPPPRTHTHTPRPRLDADFRALPCDPACLRCGRPEHPDGLNYCQPACATICRHTAQPFRADVCITLQHTRAHVVTSPHTGKQHAVVTCPWCSRTHWHSATATSPYRISGCSKPYIVQAPAPVTNLSEATA